MNVKHLERAASNDQATSAKKISTKEGPPTSPVLRPSSKIRDRHWERLAIVYIRQSSPHQVLENRESRERQYALATLAQQFGWPADRVLVIDEDQGLSGKSSENREWLSATADRSHAGPRGSGVGIGIESLGTIVQGLASLGGSVCRVRHALVRPGRRL